jgi:DNA-directed RNA polymerase specialized sigma24 family protein
LYQPNKYQGLDPKIVKIISKEVEKLTGRFALEETELNDIEQDLHLHVWSGIGHLVGVPFYAAVRRIVDSRIKDIIKERKRACRDYTKRAFSLDEPSASEEEPDLEIGQLVDLAQHLERTAGKSTAWQARRHFSADVSDAIESLPKDLRLLCSALDALDGNLVAAARELNLSRKKARVGLEKLQTALRHLCGDS